MGGSSWSDDSYRSRVTSRVADRGTAFAYSKDVADGKVDSKAHPTLDPKGLKMRESRDSDAHPESNAIAIVLDTTGSMRAVVNDIHAKLPTLMGILTRKGYIPDPQIMFSAIGDATARDLIPLQVGQFESGDEMEGDISNMYLLNGGGGSMEESYELGAYVLARHTSIDCFEKRGKKGYAFFIGDETPYSRISRTQVEGLIGPELEADVRTEVIFKELLERYHVFFILPAGASHGREIKTILEVWGRYINEQNVLELADAKAVAELIATQIGLYEGSTDIDAAAKDLEEHGTSKALVSVVRNAVSKDSPNGALARVPAGSLTPSGDASSVKRL